MSGLHNDMHRRAGSETTFALIKSHAVKANLVGIILRRIMTDMDVTIVATAPRFLTKDEIARLYFEHTDRPYYATLCMSVADKCVPMALIGPNAIQAWRDMLGATDPAKAAMGTLRGDHGNPEIMAENVAHGSDSREAAERELAIFFPASIAIRPGA